MCPSNFYLSTLIKSIEVYYDSMVIFVRLKHLYKLISQKPIKILQ